MEKDKIVKRWDETKHEKPILQFLYVFPARANKMYCLLSDLVTIHYEGELTYGEILGKYSSYTTVVCNSFGPMREMLYQYPAIALPGTGSHMNIDEVRDAMLLKSHSYATFKQTSKNLMQSTLYLYSNTTGTPTVVDTKGKLAECDNLRIRELSKGYNTFVLADPTSTDLDLSVVHRKVCVFAADLDGIEAWTYISSTQNPAYSMYPPDLIIDRERYTSAKNAIDFMKLGATLSGSSLSSAEAANALGTTSSEDMVTPVELDDIKPIKKTTLSTFLLGELSQFKNKEGPTSKLLSVVNEHFAINFGINEFVFTVNQLDGFSANAGTIKVWIK